MLLLDLMGEEDLAHVSIGPFVSRGLSLAPTGALCAIVRYYICICHFLNFLWTHWDWLMLIDADWCWLMLIDMLIYADWYVDWCLLTWFFLIDDQLRFNQVFFCRSVPPEFLRSFLSLATDCCFMWPFHILIPKMQINPNVSLCIVFFVGRLSNHLPCTCFQRQCIVQFQKLHFSDKTCLKSLL